MSADEGLVRIGRVIKPHGIRGELVVAAEGQTLAELPVGTAVLVAAVASAMVGLDLREIADWAFEVFSVTFMVILGIMLAGFAYCLVRLIECRKDGENGDVWLEAAVHLAGGVATVALTYTLLGISLGIASLSHQPLTPDTVQDVIGQLTRHFSVAFLTSVVGVPTAAGLRAMVMVTETRIQARPAQTESSRL